MIDRRTALAGITGLFGAALIAPLARLAAQTNSAVQAISTGAPTAPVFTPAQRALVDGLSERVLPTTDTPGALAAGVPEFIEKLLADWSYPEERKPILAGLDALDGLARSQFGKPASALGAAQQDALLTLAMEDKFAGGAAFFEAFRQMVITGYFTSEIGIMQERHYLPIPGTYDGAYLYSNVNKVFSA